MIRKGDYNSFCYERGDSIVEVEDIDTNTAEIHFEICGSSYPEPSYKIIYENHTNS